MTRLKVDASDIERMASQTLLNYGPDEGAKVSRFWILSSLAAVIATAGVAADSVATVIGAMIVAPLMNPILGTALALVFANHNEAARSMLAVLGGALLVISIAFLLGMIEPLNTLTEDNTQVSSRTHPTLIDLIAALATGSVGAFALVRRDISDTLPGVAIAISLVPPLSVAGLTLQDGKTTEALGALLLFFTNVAAIIFTATIVLLIYRVRDTALKTGHAVGRLRGWSLAAVVSMVIAVAVPLTLGTQQVLRENWMRYRAAPLADKWARADGWRIVELEVYGNEIRVAATGERPEIPTTDLRDALNADGLQHLDLVVHLIVGGRQRLPATNH